METMSTVSQNIVSLYTEATPNPNTLKFVANKMIFAEGQAELDRKEVEQAPFVAAIFNEFDYVTSAFVSNNFITLTKNDDTEWYEVMGEVRNFIKDYLGTNQVIFEQAFIDKIKADTPALKGLEEDSTIEEKITFILDKYVRPGVAADGGAIDFKSSDAEAKKVNLIMRGSCSGCPSSQVTLKNGVQALFERYLPEEVKEVEAVEE